MTVACAAVSTARITNENTYIDNNMVDGNKTKNCHILIEPVMMNLSILLFSPAAAI